MDPSIWIDDQRTRWPRVAGANLFLAQSVDLIGRHLFGDDWQITDMVRNLRMLRRRPEFDPRPATPTPSIASPNWGRAQLSAAAQFAEQRREHDQKCALIDKLNEEASLYNATFGVNHQRATDVKRAIVAQAAAGALGTFYLSEVDGTPHSIPMGFWASGSAFMLFDDCRVSEQPWMRDSDGAHRHAVFVSNAQLRAIDWKNVQWRPQPAPLGEPEPASDKQASPPSRNQRLPRGRRPKWNWSQMSAEIVRIADQDGLHTIATTQADLERWAATWFAERNGGESPGESSIRVNIAPIFQEIEAHNRRKAGK